MVNIANMMKQAQAMQKKMLETQEELSKKEYTGNAGGGVVSITIDGKGFLNKVKISQELANPEEIEILEDLIVAAFNDAKKKQSEDSESSLSGVMGGMNMPAGLKFPF
ncbi:MAG: YbaB/EbfC family nucleoid-associated protein [Pseudomonadota bacterium]